MKSKVSRHKFAATITVSDDASLLDAFTDRARRMRQCLTPNCDAPRFLVGPTGYCAECVEKQRRENPSPSKSTRARNHSRVDSGIPTSCQNAQNAPVIECIRAIEHDRTAEAEETVDTVLQLLGHMKQLTALVKGNGKQN